MKNFTKVVLALVLAVSLATGGAIAATQLVSEEEVSAPVPEQKIVMMSYNIRCFSLSFGAPDAWSYRSAAFFQHIKNVNPDIIGFQEVTAVQRPELVENLTDYTLVGQGRDDGEAAGESSSIAFRTERFELLDYGTFWISKTPDIVSYGWDAGHRRVCTYVVLKDKNSGKTFAHYNTHLDNRGKKAQFEGAKLITDRVVNCGYPAFFSGDLNFDESETASYNAIADKLDNTKYIAEESKSGPSYHNYHELPADTTDTEIDHVFCTPGDFRVYSYEVCNYKTDGVFTSDHFAIKVVLELK